MQVKFSEDVIPLSDLKINPGKVVGRAQDTYRPILLTSLGRMDHIRELIHAPSRVVYLRQAKEVVLIRVWRSERQLELPDNET